MNLMRKRLGGRKEKKQKNEVELHLQEKEKGALPSFFQSLFLHQEREERRERKKRNGEGK